MTIWLILPVVIRLCQRLSHACLSISKIHCLNNLYILFIILFYHYYIFYNLWVNIIKYSVY